MMEVQMSEYPISPLAMLFPPMLDEDFDKLVSSIQEQGLLEPITLYQGEIIDGRHRYKACKQLGIECQFTELNDDTDPITLVGCQE